MMSQAKTFPGKIAMFGTVAALVTALATPPAMAEWGPRQQGIVTGVAATALLGAILYPSIVNKPAPAPAPVVQPVQPVYYTPAPTYTASIYSTPAATAFNSYEPAQRKQIQSRLAALGYYSTTIDGDFGPNTYNAVVAYANASGKPSLLSSQSGAFTIYDGLIY